MCAAGKILRQRRTHLEGEPGLFFFRQTLMEIGKHDFQGFIGAYRDFIGIYRDWYPGVS